MLQSSWIKMSHRNLDRCSVPRPGSGSPCLESWPSLIVLCFPGRAPSREDPVGQQPAGTGHFLGQEPSARRLLGGRGLRAGTCCQQRLITEIALISWVPTESTSSSLQGQHGPEPLVTQAASKGSSWYPSSNITNIAHKPGPSFDSSYWKPPDKCLSLSCCCI